MAKFVVVGAGVVGASVAYALAERGMDVTVLDAVHPAAGTTSNSFAWANANEKLPRTYFNLNDAGVREHHRLAVELNGDWFQPTGNLEIAARPDRQASVQTKVERLRSWGYAARVVDATEAGDLAPDLAPSALESSIAAFYPDEGWVAGPVLVARLLQAVRERGGEVSFPRRVSDLELDGTRVTGVVVDGERIPAGVVLDCAGPRAGLLLEAHGLRVRRQRSPGLLIVTNDVATTLERVVHLDDVYLRPDGAGRIRVGAVGVDDLLPTAGDFEPSRELVSEIFRRATRAVPLLESSHVEAIRLGWRPLPADGWSAVGPISGLDGYYLIFTHSGITLGPVLGKLAAQELATGEASPLLHSFRPDRLTERIWGNSSDWQPSEREKGL